MKKCKLAAMAWLSVCIVLFTSCGNSAGVSAGSTSEVKSTAVSEAQRKKNSPMRYFVRKKMKQNRLRQTKNSR